MTKDEITRPEPGSLPAQISFIEQTDGSTGYYVRFKDVPEDAGEEPERKYIPILQHETQEEALQAAIDYRDRRAKELGLPVDARQGPPHRGGPRADVRVARVASASGGSGSASIIVPGPSTRSLWPCGPARRSKRRCSGAWEPGDLGDRPAAGRLPPGAHPHGDAGGGAHPARGGGSSAPARCNCTGPRAR